MFNLQRHMEHEFNIAVLRALRALIAQMRKQ